MKKVLEKQKAKQVEVLFILLNSSACKEHRHSLPAYSKRYGLSQSDTLAVVNFYSEDEVSQISPNIKRLRLDSIA